MFHVSTLTFVVLAMLAQGIVAPPAKHPKNHLVSGAHQDVHTHKAAHQANIQKDLEAAENHLGELKTELSAVGDQEALAEIESELQDVIDKAGAMKATALETASDHAAQVVALGEHLAPKTPSPENKGFFKEVEEVVAVVKKHEKKMPAALAAKVTKELHLITHEMANMHNTWATMNDMQDHKKMAPASAPDQGV